jgi:Beta-galactosidase/beta-glucuronidase
MLPKFTNFLVACVLLIVPFLSYSQKDIRIKQNFDFDWKFILNDSVEARATNFTESKWENVQLPHDWSIKLPLDEKNGGSMGFMPGGMGWYRKTFTIPADYKNRKITVNFDGVYHQSNVYINGKHLGFHPYGYTGFTYDLTPFLNFGSRNTIVVQVDHRNSPSSRWYSGSGIYRHVWLTITNPVRVSNWGIFVSTPTVSKAKAEIRAEISVENSQETTDVQIFSRVLDNKGTEVASARSPIRIEKDKQATISQSLSLTNPELWSIETPTLYSLETTLKVKGKVADVYKTSFGIRTVRFDANKGFFLNEENIKLKGMNLHPDAGSLGTAVPDKSYLRRLKILKEYGCNAIRCSHNPPSPEFLDMCDSLGFVIVDEIFDKWKSVGEPWGYYAKYFDEWWQKDLDAMLLRDRNHPSIILWSLGNETAEQNDTTGVGTARVKMLQERAHTIDPTRKATAVISPSDVSKRYYNKNGFNEALDVVGMNYQEPWMQDDKKQFPNRIMFIAEAFPYYTGRHNSIRDYNPTNPWYTVANNDFIFGQFIWAGVDYLGESSGWPSTGWPTCPFDACMFEKPRAAFHRSVWNKMPMVRIAVADQSLDIDPGKDHWSWPNLADHWTFPQYKGRIIEVETTSNCEQVELWVNEKSMGRRKVADYTNNTVVWHVPYMEGRILAKGYNAGGEVAQYELKTAGRPVGIILKSNCETIKADGQDLAHISIFLVDDKGVVVPNADQYFEIEISGNGILKGLDNGDLRREGSYAGNRLKTYFGKALATVQSIRKSGEITLKVKSKDYPEAVLTVKSE